MATCVQCGKSGLLLKLMSDGRCVDCAEQHRQFLLNRVAELSTPEYQNLSIVRAKIDQANQQLIRLQQQSDMVQQQINKKQMDAERELHAANLKVQEASQKLQELQEQLVQAENEMEIQSYGLYPPRFEFAHSSFYQEKLANIRNEQKQIIKEGLAATGSTSWTVNNNAAKGKKMVKDMQKLLIRAFNTECDDVIDRVKYNNYEASQKRIHACRDAISKLGVVMDIAITDRYFKLKQQELELAYQYRQAKQKEKEEQKELRAQMREEARVQKALEEERAKLEKEQKHYQNALAKLEEQLLKDPDNADLLEKKHELTDKLSDTQRAISDVDYREANKRAGYVYVISNIGSFGKDVYKIGMTRRLDPTERVDELGDASVPFDFDIHAMIFSEDAPGLEAALHHAFADRKVNMVNTRREFFHVSLEEIKAVIAQNFDKTVEFVDIPDAEQFHMSESLRKASIN